MHFKLRLLFTTFVAAATFQTPLSASQPSASVEKLANEYVTLRLQYDPTLAGEVGLPPPSNMHLPERSKEALRHLHTREDTLLAQLKTIDAAAAKDAEPTYSVLREELESRRGLRVCRSELWDLSQTEGWQIELPGLAATQPVATPEERKRALSLWRTLPAYLQTDIANLRTGLASGYFVPRSVVSRVLKQLDGLVPASPEASPLYLPARRAKDPEFERALRKQIAQEINPAIRQYAAFLRTEYLPRAKEVLGLSALPNGAACYQAYLRRYTTTELTPKLVFASGQKIVADSTAEIKSIGGRLYQTTNIAQIIQRTHDDPRNRFTSPERLLQFSIEIVERSEQKSRELFQRLPSQPVAVEPLPEYQRGSGVGSHYQPNPDARQHATFWISTDDWANETRGAAEITAVHETVPGHHLQIAIARRLEPPMQLSKLAFNSAYAEGWAHYAEQLSEEQNIDGDDYERIQRRVLAGRSLVIDPGIHAFSWTRQQAEAFAREAGMSKDQADDVIDRIVVEPGQLTSYEIGGLEILSLREVARKSLGTKFDLRAFHQCVLEQGSIPLSALREHVQNWIASQRQ